MAAPADAPVRAVWRAHRYSGPAYRYDCPSAKQALDQFLDTLGARNVRSWCSWQYGLAGAWDALAPEGQGRARAAAGRVIESASGEGWLAEADGRWQAQDEAVDASWRRGGVRISMAGGGQACVVYAEVFDLLLEEHPVRDVRQMVSCNGGSGFIDLSFEHLSPL